MDLGKMVDKIQSYNEVLSLHKYERQDCGGVKPWSHRFTKGTEHIDVRGSDWTAYSGDQEVCTGSDPLSLAAYLNEDYKTGGDL